MPLIVMLLPGTWKSEKFTPRLIPVMVTVVPPLGGAEEGENPVIIG